MIGRRKSRPERPSRRDLEFSVTCLREELDNLRKDFEEVRKVVTMAGALFDIDRDTDR